MIRQILTDTITSVFQSDTALVVDTKFQGVRNGREDK